MANTVIPAKAGIQLHFVDARSWTPTFVGVTSIQSPGMTNFQTIMAGLDPAISRKQ
jgi:hypothetical protein